MSTSTFADRVTGRSLAYSQHHETYPQATDHNVFEDMWLTELDVRGEIAVEDMLPMEDK